MAVHLPREPERSSACKLNLLATHSPSLVLFPFFFSCEPVLLSGHFGCRRRGRICPLKAFVVFPHPLVKISLVS